MALVEFVSEIDVDLALFEFEAQLTRLRTFKTLAAEPGLKPDIAMRRASSQAQQDELVDTVRREALKVINKRLNVLKEDKQRMGPKFKAQAEANKLCKKAKWLLEVEVETDGVG